MNEPLSTTQPADPPVLLFDGVCNLCTASVQFVLRRDRREVFRFAALQSEAGRRLVARHGLDPEALHTLVLVDGDRAFVRSAAALRVAGRLSGLWPLLRVFLLVPRPLRDAAYDWIARHRYRWFGRRESCLLPTPELRRRFLDPQ